MRCAACVQRLVRPALWTNAVPGFPGGTQLGAIDLVFRRVCLMQLRGRLEMREINCFKLRGSL